MVTISIRCPECGGITYNITYDENNKYVGPTGKYVCRECRTIFKLVPKIIRKGRKGLK